MYVEYMYQLMCVCMCCSVCVIIWCVMGCGIESLCQCSVFIWKVVLVVVSILLFGLVSQLWVKVMLFLLCLILFQLMICLGCVGLMKLVLDFIVIVMWLVGSVVQIVGFMQLFSIVDRKFFCMLFIGLVSIGLVLNLIWMWCSVLLQLMNCQLSRVFVWEGGRLLLIMLQKIDLGFMGVLMEGEEGVCIRIVLIGLV